MDISIEKKQGVTVIRLADRFDAYTAPAVKEKLLALQEAGQVNVLVDLSAVDFVDSTGLATLVAGLKHCRRAGGELMLLGLQPRVRVIFGLTRLDHAFRIFDDEVEALRGFQKEDDAA